MSLLKQKSYIYRLESKKEKVREMKRSDNCRADDDEGSIL